jgi:DNA-binding MarR family transcriptional regulator
MSQGGAEDRPGYRVKQVQQLLRHAGDDALRPLGLSMSQYAVLSALAELPGASSAELARRCFITRQSLGDVLTPLRTAALVEVGSAGSGGRSRPVALTEAGRARLAEADEAMVAVEERMVAGMSALERHAFVALLATCADNLS